jgi:hypothetical protein
VNRIIRGGGEGTATVTRGTRDEMAVTRSAPLFLPSLPASYQATIHFEAEREIRREARRMYLASNGDMHETGGWLLSLPRSPDRVVHATYPGDDALHARDAMRLGTERLEAVRAQLPHLRVSGSWHVHDDDGEGIPSETDRNSWATWRELDGGFHIGLIATLGRSSDWTDPELHGWIVTEDFCERLALKREWY